MDKIFLASPFFFVPSIILNNLITSSLCTNSIGTLFGFGSFYDTLIEYCGVGATLPIISFGHSLVDSAIECAKEEGFIGIFKGIYNTTAPGIAFTIFLSLFLGIFFKPKR